MLRCDYGRQDWCRRRTKSETTADAHDIHPISTQDLGEYIFTHALPWYCDEGTIKHVHKLARLNNTGNSYFLSQDWLFLRAISCMIESLLEYMLLVSSLNFRFLPVGSGHVLLSVQYLRWIFWGWRFAKGFHLIQVQQQVLFNPRKTYMLMSMVRKGLYTAHGIIKQTRSKEILIK